MTWFCQCDCGGTITTRAGQLTSGKTRSCGCMFRRPFGETAKLQILTRYKKKAAKYKQAWELTDEQFFDLIVQPCHYCGSEPSSIQGGFNTTNSHGAFTYNGIDRVSGPLGYTMLNCVTCCGACNHAKFTMPYDMFKKWLTRAYQHFVRGKRNGKVPRLFDNELPLFTRQPPS